MATSDGLFEAVTPVPDNQIDARTGRLVGFDERYEALEKNLQLLLAPDSLRQWSRRHHKCELPLLDVLLDRYPLVLFHGDVGTGKTAVAEGMASRFAKAARREAFLYKLSTRVRGTGLHGEMSKLVGEAFERVETEIGKNRLGFLLIDEADALASTRDMLQSHQEEKAGTNTLIQKLDDARKFNGRLIVLLCTNRLAAVDPAVVRRAAQLVEFKRPTAAEREKLLQRDLAHVALTKGQLEDLVKATGPDKARGRTLGLTFSDLRTRFLPAAVLRAFPDTALTFDILMTAAEDTRPSPAIASLEEHPA